MEIYIFKSEYNYKKGIQAAMLRKYSALLCSFMKQQQKSGVGESKPQIIKS